ncbi:long-chain fatty acid--CoA ligase [Nakamurella flava]|uniref:Acyl-CoA synthetase n=1 Tax=Nakamurella flava TaxID=2576308 RepID=A0A4U6QMD1_9ACTN|nr:long-chain fatty acid--CoA ligase [Nakamurella flava]TKV61780.1 long-chain fatty acid--CoA ligase [Nakamurella flava]
MTAPGTGASSGLLSEQSPSFGHLFLARVAATPDRPAYQYLRGGDWETITYAQTRDRVTRLAAGLIDLGVQAQDRVAIASATRIEWILADLAVVCAGAATTSIYPTTTAEDVAYILGDSGSVVAIVENAEQLDKIRRADLPALRAVVLFDADGVPLTEGDPGDGLRLLSLDQLSALGAARLTRETDLIERRLDGIDGESLATLIYTSGTTGRPKGVRLVHANWMYEGRAVAALHILSENDVQYLWLPLSHVLGKVLTALQLELGFSTAVDGDLTKIVENLAVVRPTFMGGAPRIFEKVRAKVTLTAQGHGGPKAKIFDWAIGVGVRAVRLRQQGRSPGPLHKAQLALADKLVYGTIRERLGGRIRFFVSGSAPLAADVAEWFDAVGMRILEGYGLTETSGPVSVNLPKDTRIGTVGPPLPGTEFGIAEDGEILVRGGSVMRGYHGNDEATAEVLTEDGWFHTGDIGELLDGYLRVTDRKKDLIKTSGGKYVAPQKIEVLFKADFPYASQIVVHGDGRKFVSAIITLDPEMITDWAGQNGLGDRSHAELADEPAVQKLVQDAVDQLNGKLERWETVKKFIVLDRDLQIEDGEMTPSMKVRRRAVEAKFASDLDKLYQD